VERDLRARWEKLRLRRVIGIVFGKADPLRQIFATSRTSLKTGTLSGN